LAFDRLRFAVVLAVLGAVACELAACGRAGGPVLPPGPAIEPAPTAQAAPPVTVPPAPASTIGGPVASGPAAQETAQKNGFDAYGNPVAPAGPKKSFVLDPLLQ